MRVGVPGPLEVTADGAAVEIGGARVRAPLVRPAVAAGRVVTTGELADALWPDDKPADEVAAVRSLVSRLRRALPADVLRSAHGGYRLDVPADAVDALRFDRLARRARSALAGGDPMNARHLAAEALTLWRGPALADAAGAPFAVGYAAGLDETRLTVVEDGAEADLACGRARGWSPDSPTWPPGTRCGNGCRPCCRAPWSRPAARPRRWRPTRRSAAGSPTNWAPTPARTCARPTGRSCAPNPPTGRAPATCGCR